MKPIISLMLLLLYTTPVLANEKLAVVLMHGKWGMSTEHSLIATLVEHLKNNNVLVVAPEMPWSRDRGLDKTYEDSMLEIHEVVTKLRAQGATKVVVGGHSMGANAALGYASRYSGLAGVLAIAPGHVPEIRAYQDKIDNDWQRAKQMVDSGNGNSRSEFNDLNDGDVSTKNFKAAIYLSWYSPTGPASMPVNTSNLKPSTPLLWIIGEKDRMYQRGENYAYSKAPHHPKNLYLVVKGGHKATPKIGKGEILDWLHSLDY